MAMETKDGLVYVTNGESFRRALARANIVSNDVRAQGASNAGIRQLVEVDGAVQGIWLSPTLQADYQLYNSKSQGIGGASGFIYGLSLNMLQQAAGSGSITYNYTPPTTEGLQLLTIPLDSADKLDLSESGTPIKVKVDYSYAAKNPVGERTIDINVSVNDEPYFSASGIEMPVDGEASVTVPFFPVFESTASGDFRIQASSTENRSGYVEYIQKGLTFQDDLIEYTIPRDGLASFSNTLVWDYGTNPGAVSQASWEIEITNPDGQVVDTLTGTGKDIQYTWDSSILGLTDTIRLKPKALAVQDGGTPVYGYKIKAKALAYAGVPPFTPDIFYETDDGPAELKITNTKVTPENPFEEPGSTVTVTGDALCYKIPESSVSWSIDLKDPEGNVVKTNLAHGEGCSLEAEWDGTIDGVAVEDPVSYVFSLRATTCGDETMPRSTEAIRAQEMQCMLAQQDVPIGATLLIFKPTDLKSAIAASFDNPNKLSIDGAVRLSEIQEYAPWKIVLKGMDKAQPDKLQVKLKGSVTGIEATVDVFDSDNDGTYEGNCPSDPTKVVRSDAKAYCFGYILHKNDEDVRTFNPIIDLRVFRTTLSDIASSLQTLGLNLPSPYYAYASGPRFGTLEYLTTVENAPFDKANPINDHMVNPATIPSNHAIGSISNFTKYGFEDVVVSYNGLAATVKTQNLASFYLLIAHGGDDSILDLSDFSAAKDSNNNSVLRRNLEKLNPLRLNISTRKIASNLYGVTGAPANLNHLKTLALTSCNVLDVYDYNNLRVGSTTSTRRVSPDDQVSVRSFPGINWWKATRYNAKGIEPDGSSFPQGYDGPILFGYNYPVQQLLVDEILQKYRKELARLRGQVGDNVLQQYAWLKANAPIRIRDFKGSPRNACAWDAQYYYYISYTNPDGLDFKFVRIPLVRIPGFLAMNPPSGDSASPRQSDRQKNGLPPAALEVKIP